MDKLLGTLSVTALLIFFSLLIFLFTILCFIKRSGFGIIVNCWFCNSWAKVCYADRNSFYCPFCLQYNGFNKDGGYNKVVEEQFATSNTQYTKVLRNNQSSCNGLCLYCNNNQQLKIRQLANFIPLNEKNYDIEIEHFRAQLENSYKLCTKCDKVLKKTLRRQQAWIFGNHIKNIKKNGLSVLKKSKEFTLSKKNFVAHFLRYLLILISFIILYQALNANVEYHKSSIQQYIPQTFLPYMSLFNIMPGTKDMKMRNVMLPITCIGLVLKMILLIRQSDFSLWKINKPLSWIILNIISLYKFHVDYFIYTNLIQMLCCIINIYGLGEGKPSRRRFDMTKKCVFKKLKVSREEENDYSDTEEDIFSSYFNDSLSNKSYKSSKNLTSSYSQLSSSPIFGYQNMPQSTASLNSTFTTARDTRYSPLFNTSSKYNSDSSGDELSHSLDHLHLSNSSFKLKSCTSPTIPAPSRNRPIILPSRLTNVTQSSWMSGGFWDLNYPVVHNTSNSQLFPNEQSLGSDVEMASVYSEPTYLHSKPIKPSYNIYQTRSCSALDNSESQLHCRGTVFHPTLKPNMSLIHDNDIPFNVHCGFRNMSLGNFNVNSLNNITVTKQKPVISSLFRNVPGVSPEIYTFRDPQF